jgi:hypothetical protein
MDEILNKAKLSDKDLKLRLRIADYAVLNLYSWSTQHTEKIWEKFELKEFIWAE